MNPLGALMRGRARAESIMDTTVLVETVAVATNATTGADVVTSTLVYQGPARVKGPTQASTTVPATVMSESVHFPATAPTVMVGARVTVLASATQPNLIGSVYRVTRSHLAEYQTAQRVEVESWQ